MENLQPAPSQKTSFWDFRHKKTYKNLSEKLIDFTTGFFLAPVIYFWFILLFGLLKFLPPRSGLLGLSIPFLLFFGISIYIINKRKYFMLGIFIGGIVPHFLYFYMVNP